MQSLRPLQHFSELQKSKADSQLTVRFVLALPVFPGRCQPSIVGRSELNYRVRNGNGWTLALISTNFSPFGLYAMHTCRKRRGMRGVFMLSISGNKLYYKGLRCSCQEPFFTGDPYRIRTDVNGVRGRCLNHLTNGPCRRKKLRTIRFRLCQKLIPLRSSSSSSSNALLV